MSPSIIVRYGPARTRERSTTLRPSSGPLTLGWPRSWWWSAARSMASRDCTTPERPACAFRIETLVIGSTMTSEIEIRTRIADDMDPPSTRRCRRRSAARWSEEAEAQWKRVLDFDKMLVATTRQAGSEAVVGTAGWLPMEMAVPGGELPSRPVTMVTVPSDHRRRGILRQLMRRQLDDLHARRTSPSRRSGPPRSRSTSGSGTGSAFVKGRIDVDPRRAAFLGGVGSDRSARLDQEQAPSCCRTSTSARSGHPGQLPPTPLWWEVQVLGDQPYRRHGASPMFRGRAGDRRHSRGVRPLPGPQSNWGPNALPNNEIDVLEALGTSPAATREVWRYLLNIDLAGKVRTHRLNAQHPAVPEPGQSPTAPDDRWRRHLGQARRRRPPPWRPGDTPARDASPSSFRTGSAPGTPGVWTLEAGPTARRSVGRRHHPSCGCPTPTLPRCTSARSRARHLLARLAAWTSWRPGAARRADLLFHSDVPPWCLDDF